MLAQASSDLSQVRLIFAMLPITIANVMMFLLVMLVLVVIDPILGLAASLMIPILFFTANRYAGKTMVERLRSTETLAEWVRESDDRAAAAERSRGDLDGLRSSLAKLEGQRPRIVEAWEEGHYSKPTRDEKLSKVDAKIDDLRSRIHRMSLGLAEAEAFSFSMADLRKMSVSVMGIQPGDEGETDIDAKSGAEFVIVPGWDDILADLKRAARTVLDGKSDDLPAWAIEWVEAVAVRFDVRAYIADAGERNPTVAFRGSVDWRCFAISIGGRV